MNTSALATVVGALAAAQGVDANDILALTPAEGLLVLRAYKEANASHDLTPFEEFERVLARVAQDVGAAATIASLIPGLSAALRVL